MSTQSYAMKDSATMLRRNLLHMVGYPTVTLLVIAIPVVILLLFVYAFGGTLGAGLGVGLRGRAAYVNYVTPGIILLAVAGAAQGTAISVAMDMAEGIISGSVRWGSPAARCLPVTSSAARSRRCSAWRSSSASPW